MSFHRKDTFFGDLIFDLRLAGDAEESMGKSERAEEEIGAADALRSKARRTVDNPTIAGGEGDRTSFQCWR